MGLFSACDGIIGDATPRKDPGVTDSFVCEDPDKITLGSAPVRRLTNVEYDNTVRDLFGGSIPQLPEQPSDAVREGTFENDALSLGPDDVRTARYEVAAIALGEHAVNNGAARARVIPCTSANAMCGEQFVQAFGKRAFRRPLTPDEFARWGLYFESQRIEIDFDAAVQLTTSAMLQSPQFLYRLESDAGQSDEEGQLELTPHQVASRLSYFLWESMPDDELFSKADAGELSTDTQIEAEARRMLLDGRARNTIRNFHRQWLYLDKVLDEEKDPELFPRWDAQVRQSAKEETLLFVENLFLDGGTINDLLTSNVAYVDDVLAGLYGIPAPLTPWSEVSLDPTQRAGLLSRFAFLSGGAHAANGSPPLRGVYVMERFLCQKLPAPPPDADTSTPTAEPGQGPFTNRELFEQRTSSSSCQGCHTRIDGFGFGFESYDAIGMFRSQDNGLAVDASGFAYDIGNDAGYGDSIELQTLLGQSEVVRDCVAQQWFTYANGRPVERADACQLEAIQTALEQNGGNLKELLVDIITRPEFRLRKEEQE